MAQVVKSLSLTEISDEIISKCCLKEYTGNILTDGFETDEYEILMHYPELDDNVKIYEVWDKYLNEVTDAICNDYGLIYKTVN